MQSEFEKYIQSYFGTSKELTQRIVGHFTVKTLRKGDFLLKEGAYCDTLSFVEAGLLREYLSDENGREVTKWIATPGYFVVDIASFLFDQPARWNLQALTDCELLVIHKQEYTSIGQQIPAWNDLEKRFISRCFSILEQRIVMHLSLSSEERYELFFKHNKELFHQVPLHYLASMLGMTPETFSRIRKKQMRKTS
jgi:CRP/FNR family transcriptional regulator, anaerobic regulatory protein